MGIILFSRHKGRVRATNAAKELYKYWSDIVMQMDASIENAQIIQQNRLRRIIIADDDIYPNDTYLLPIIDQFETLYPEMEISIIRSDPKIILRMLQNNECDLAFLQYTNKAFLEENGFEALTLLHLPPYIVISDANPLSLSDKIQMEDLKEYPLAT